MAEENTPSKEMVGLPARELLDLLNVLVEQLEASVEFNQFVVVDSGVGSSLDVEGGDDVFGLDFFRGLFFSWLVKRWGVCVNHVCRRCLSNL